MSERFRNITRLNTHKLIQPKNGHIGIIRNGHQESQRPHAYHPIEMPTAWHQWMFIWQDTRGSHTDVIEDKPQKAHDDYGIL
jgi:hypothetical protein